MTKQPDIVFNGYSSGVQFTPIVNAYLTDLSKSGARGVGSVQQTVFTWDRLNGIQVLPPEMIGTYASTSRYGDWVTVNYDADGDGISQAALRNAERKPARARRPERRHLRRRQRIRRDQHLRLGRRRPGTHGSRHGVLSTRTATAFAKAVRLVKSCPSSGELGHGHEGARHVEPAAGLAVDPRARSLRQRRGRARHGQLPVHLRLGERWPADRPHAALWRAVGLCVERRRAPRGVEPYDKVTFFSQGVGLWDHAGGLTRIGAPSWCRHVPYVASKATCAKR